LHLAKKVLTLKVWFSIAEKSMFAKPIQKILLFKICFAVCTAFKAGRLTCELRLEIGG